jgi:hypothetical protein
MKSSSIKKRVDKVIEKYKEAVTIQVFAEPTYSDYGDLISQVTSEYTNVPALFNRYSKDTQIHPEGIFELGDSSIFFKGTQEGIEVGNVVTRSNGERWKITKVANNFLNYNSMVREAGVKQIEPEE